MSISTDERGPRIWDPSFFPPATTSACRLKVGFGPIAQAHASGCLCTPKNCLVSHPCIGKGSTSVAISTLWQRDKLLNKSLQVIPAQHTVHCFSAWNQSVTFRFRNFSVLKLFHFFCGFGFGIEKNWYQKKYRIQYRKFLVSKKVSDSVSEKFGIGKSFGFGFV